MSNSSPVATPEQRVAALEAALDERGHDARAFAAEFKNLAEEKWVPENGARLVAKAWTDPAFKQRLLTDGRAAAAELGLPMPPHHRHLVVLENTPTLQNVIVCTQCSCTAFTIIGLPPDWYKDFEYRARAVRESRTVLREMGLDLPPRFRSACGTLPPTPATWFCRCSRRTRSVGRKPNSPNSSPRTP